MSLAGFGSRFLFATRRIPAFGFALIPGEWLRGLDGYLPRHDPLIVAGQMPAFDRYGVAELNPSRVRHIDADPRILSQLDLDDGAAGCDLKFPCADLGNTSDDI